MSYYGSSSSGGRSGRRVDYGRTYVVRPKGRHLATIVWLHGLGDSATVVQAGPSSWIPFPCQISSGYAPQQQPGLSRLLVDSPALLLCNVAAYHFIGTLKHGKENLKPPFSGTETGFDVEDTSVDGRDDIEGLDASAAHIANMLSSEPSDVKLGIDGFSMGAAVALHSAACYAHGKFTSGIPYPISLSAVISLSGWLPCSRTLRGKMERNSHMAPADDVVTYRDGERSSEILRSSGFSYLYFKSYNGLGHYTTPEEMDGFCK